MPDPVLGTRRPNVILPCKNFPSDERGGRGHKAQHYKADEESEAYTVLGAGVGAATKATPEVFMEEAALSYLATLYSCCQDSRSLCPVPHSCHSHLALLPLQPNLHPLRRRPPFLPRLENRSSDISVLSFLLS